MVYFRALFILSVLVSRQTLAVIVHMNSRQGYQPGFSNFMTSSEKYVGPSSYTTSFGIDYPGFGDFGSNLNFHKPQISSSYSSYGPSESNEFGSTSYTNYPPKVEYEMSKQQSYSQLSSSYPPQSSFDSKPQTVQSQVSSSHYEETPISEHIEVIKPVVVPVYKRFPYPVAKKFPVAIPHPVLVPVPAPYPVHVEVSQAVAVPVLREIRVPVEREVPYPVDKYVPVPIEKPVPYHVEKHYPVYVQKPYPVKIPVVRTFIRKNPKRT